MANLGSVLTKNAIMNPGDTLVSPNGGYTLLMATSGNVVFNVTGSGGSPIWQAGTSGTGNYCQMRVSGDFVVYNSANTHISHSETSGTDNQLVVGNDGYMRILTQSGAELVPAWDNGSMFSY